MSLEVAHRVPDAKSVGVAPELTDATENCDLKSSKASI
jgi:hypothetical protein